jgi:alpha-ribazole phosphatase
VADPERENGARPPEDNHLYQKRIRERLEHDTGRQRTRVYFVRHGETQSNLDGLFCGQSETALTDLGIRQAQQLAFSLAAIPFAAAYASDLSRCLDTASLALHGRDLPVVPDPRLREMAYGEWEMKSGAELRKEHPDVFKRLWDPGYEFRAPGGEGVTDVRERMLAFLHDIVKHHPGHEVLAVSHGGAIQCLISEVLGMPVSHVWRLVVENTGVSVIDCYGERMLISRLNDRGHLDDPTLVSQFGAKATART